MKQRISDQLYTFRVIIEPDEPVGYHGFVPLLKGLHASGRTLEEVKKNLKEAIRCHLQGFVKDGIAIPREENTLELIQVFSAKELLASSR